MILRTELLYAGVIKKKLPLPLTISPVNVKTLRDKLYTLRENFTMKCPLKSSKSVEKEKRGFFDYR